MLLFSSAMMKHKLTFTKLSDCMQHLTLVATWAETEWGYIRNKGVEFREGVFASINEQIYIGSLHEQPLVMFALLDHGFHLDLKEKISSLPQARELMYVYVDKDYRGLGFGRQIIDEAKRLAKDAGADLILLDTLRPGLNVMYEKQGAEVFCEHQLFLHPADALVMRI